MPIYEHKCDTCEHVWEDLFKMGAPLPDACPSCGASTVKRLMSWVRGKVELSGRELNEALKGQGRAMMNKARTDENLLANLVGESKFHENMKGIK